MTKCGEQDCRYPPHQPVGLPAVVTYRPLPVKEWDRRERYDDTTPRPWDSDDTWAFTHPNPVQLLVVLLGIIVAVLSMAVIGVEVAK